MFPPSSAFHPQHAVQSTQHMTGCCTPSAVLSCPATQMVLSLPEVSTYLPTQSKHLPRGGMERRLSAKHPEGKECLESVCPVAGAEQGRLGTGLSQANVKKHLAKGPVEDYNPCLSGHPPFSQTGKFKEEEVGLNIP